MTWGRVFETIKTLSYLGKQFYCQSQIIMWVEVLFFEYTLSISISRSENNTSAGNAGISLPKRVMSIIRQATTKLIAIPRLRQLAVLYAMPSIRHPDFRTLCQSSIRQRWQYHFTQFNASPTDFTSQVINKNRLSAFYQDDFKNQGLHRVCLPTL